MCGTHLEASRLGALSQGMEHGTQVTASASWSPVALPVILFCPCFSEVISLWPSLAGCWSQHPCPKNKSPREGSHFKAWTQPEVRAGILRQTESWALDSAQKALILNKECVMKSPRDLCQAGVCAPTSAQILLSVRQRTHWGWQAPTCLVPYERTTPGCSAVGTLITPISIMISP